MLALKFTKNLGLVYSVFSEPELHVNWHCFPTSQGRREDCEVASLEMSAELAFCLPSKDCLSHELDGNATYLPSGLQCSYIYRVI